MNNVDIKNYILAWKKIIFETENRSFHHNLFYKNNVYWLIFLFISDATYNKENISYEKLCQIISQNTASRSTIYRILNNFLLEHLIFKKNSKTDSRVKYYYLSSTGKTIFENLIKNELDVFSSIKKNSVAEEYFKREN
tara:strand:- start:83 stop:496 length:414 start_codon:yes stop_codon:yes gene_type:complete